MSDNQTFQAANMFSSKRRSQYASAARRLTFALSMLFVIGSGAFAHADTPVLTTAPPAESFVGEEFCFDAGLSNVGSAGYGPYYQIITKPDYTLASADFIGLMLSPATVGTFPAAPGNQLTDPVSGLDVTGPEGGTLYTVRYPIGSVVAGQPSLDMQLCIDVDSAATIDVLEADAFELIPGYEFGDTPTGDNGATVGTRADFDFTPRVITYQVSDILAEMENPPGPAWTWDIEVVADIAADRTVTPIDFSTVSPIVLPANVQFVGPVTFTGSGVTCTATTPAAPPPESPGGSVDLDCVSGTGTPGDDEDIVVTFPVYIVDTLDEGTCGTAGAINTAKHVTVRKTSTGGTFPGGSVTYTLAFQVSEFVDGIDSLSFEDVMPDGLTFVNSPTVTYNGGAPTAITPTVANDTPGVGETTVTYDVTGVTGALLPATSGSITYTATIDQLYAGGALAGQPVRARDSLANSVIGTYDITNGANACTDDSAETITVPDVTSSKSLIGSANVQAGDAVTWRLQLAVPSGDVQGIEFNDFFPLPVFDVSSIDTNSNIAANTDLSFGPNDTLGVNPLSITPNVAENRLAIVWPDVISAMGETIEVDIAVTVSNEPFADGLVLSNLFQAITDNSAVDNGDALNIEEITLQQPELSIVKTATTAASGLEAGDSVSFDIVISNDGSAEAYDVTLTDTLPSSLTSCGVDSVTGGTGAGDVFGAGFTFATFTGATANALDPGDSATIAITCDIAATAENNESIDNEVAVVWATQPGATLFPAATDTETVTTRQAQAFKSIVTTSEASTGEGTADTNGDPRPVVTGEVVRYRTWFYIPQGTLGGVSVRDLLPTGLAHIADSETLVGLVSDSGTDLTSSTLACASGTAPRAGNDATDLSTLALDCTLAIAGTGGSGQDPVLSLGTLTNSEDDGNEELVVLELNARVVGDVATGTNMANRARLQTDNGNATSGSVFAQQQNPAIEITKTVMPSTADAEDTVEYVITVAHNATDSTADAFDISFTDIIQADLTYDGGTGVTGPQAPTVADTCTAAGVVVDDADPAGAGITITFDSLPQGETCEVRYFAETAAGVVPGQTIDNTVNLGYSSLPGNGTDPNPTGSIPGAEATFTDSDTAQLTIDSVEIEKSIAATDFAHTSDASAGTALDPREVAVGETITYRLQMRLPEGTANNYEITDLLPLGLAYVAGSARVAFVFDGAGAITPTPGIVCSGGTLNQAGNEGTAAGITPTCGLEPTGGPFSSGTDPVWDLGDLVNTDMDANQEFVIVEFDARVQNETGNQDGDTLANTFELSVDGDVVTSSAVVAEVVEPQLTLAAVATPNPVDNRVDTTPTISWDITLANAGNATAFQIDSDSGGGWEVVLPAGIDSIASLTLTPTGSVFNNGTAVPVVVGDITIGTTNSANDTLTFANPFQMAPGSSLLIEFDADLLASVLPGDVPSGLDEVVYAGNDTGTTATGIRDDASLANGTGNTPITDTTDLDDYRTEVTLSVATVAENPALTVGKSITAGPVNLGTGSFTLTYTIALENTGDVGLDTIAIEDNLDTTFGAGNYAVDDVRVTSDSATLAEDVAFTGAPATVELLLPGTSSLPVGEAGAIEIDLTVTPSGSLGPFTNTAVGTSASDRTGNAANDNGAVDVTFDDGGELGLAKRVSAGPTNNNDGSYTLSYEFLIDNSGLVVLDNILLDDDLATTFADATAFSVDSVTSADFTVNFPGFDGDADTALLDGSDTLAAGTDGTVTVTLTVTPGADLGPYENFATVQADTPSGATLTDVSEDGVNPDGNSNGDPTDDSDLTIVTFVESPDIGAAKEVSSGPTNNADGSYTLTYTIVLENVGDVPLVGVQATDNLQATFAGATSFSVDSVTSADFSVNFPGFTGTGAGSLNLLDGTDGLAVGASGTIDVTVTVTPGANLGPYNNQATGSAEGPGGSNASDVSDNGSDPDGNGNGDPSDDNDVTPVTFVEDAEIGLAKAIAAGSPTNNGDGSFTLTYDLVVENSGDVALSAVQVTDDLATAFAAATSFTVDNVVSADFAVNFPGFNGDADQDLLTGADTLAAGASGTINVTVTVTPGANLGPYDNSAVATGDSPGGATVTDTSDAGTDPDGNGNGDPTDDSDPTPVTFAENPEIGLAKAIQGGVSNNGDGSYELTYRFVAENSGDSPLSDVQITDDLAAAFAGATFTVDAVVSADFTVNFPGFNGAADQDLLAAGNSLATGASGSVDVTLTVTPGANLGPYDNSADASGTAPGGGVASDTSDDGTDPDGNGNGDPTDDSDVTPVTFTENPELGLAKEIAVAPTNNLDGSFTLTYRLFLENSGDVPVNGIQISDDLATVFADATSFSVDNVTSADFAVNFPGFNGDADTDLLAGTDSLAVAASGTIDVVVTVTPGADLGPYDNTAAASGTSSGGAPVTDISQVGTDPDGNGNGDPGDDSNVTPVTFVEGPAIAIAKTVLVAPVNNNDGSYSLTYRIAVSNSGDTPLNGVQVTDDLEAIFGVGAVVVDSVTALTLAQNAAYDGLTAGDVDLLDGTDTLAVGASADIDLAITVTPGANLGPFVNAANASGTSPGNQVVNGPGNAPNVSFTETPEIGVAKQLTAAPTNNGDGTYTLAYLITVENSGDVLLNSVQVDEDLATTFALADSFSVDSVVASAGLTAAAGFDGDAVIGLLSGTDTLAAGQSETITVTVTVTPAGVLGPYNNTAAADGTSPSGAGTADNSTDGVDPDANGNGDPSDDGVPTVVTFAEAPELGLAKALATGPTNNADGSYTLGYQFVVENSGDVIVSGLQITDDLSATFAGAAFVVDALSSADLTVNAPGFNGAGDVNLLAGTDSLAVGASATVDLTVTVTPGANLGPYDNSADASGTSPTGAAVTDTSTDGADPDGNGNGDPTDDSDVTPVTFTEAPELGLAKAVTAGPANNSDGTYTLTYQFVAENSGDVDISALQITDDLAATFAGASFVVDALTSADVSVNAGGFNGAGDVNLLVGTDSLAVGATATIDLTVTVTPGGNLGPYDNSADASGTTPTGAAVTDTSTDGADPDGNGNGDPTDDSDVTPVTFTEAPELGLAKAVTAGPANNSDGTYTLTYQFVAENSGDVVVSNLQISDDLATTFADAASFTVDAVSSADLTVNFPGYDGGADTNLLAGTESLAVGASASVDVTVTVTPGADLGPYDNTATLSGNSPTGAPVSDVSDAGADPDGNGNGDPTDDSDVTSTTFNEAPQIGIAKQVTSGPVNNADGTHTLTYAFLVANTGDVALSAIQVADDLAATFAGAGSFTVDSLTSADFTVAPGYNGAGNNDLLAGSDSLAVGASGGIELVVTVTPGGNLGPYANSATASATSPANAPVSDLSDDAASVDENGNGDPGDESDSTDVTFTENPVLGLAKALLSGPDNNGDGSYSLTYRFVLSNDGDVDLSALNITEDLATVFASADSFSVDSVSSAALTTAAGFDGNANTALLAGTDVLAVGTQASVDLAITVVPGANLGPYQNVAVATGESPSGDATMDDSVAGADPDANGNGDPTDDSSSVDVTFAENPQLGLAKTATLSAPNFDGTFTTTIELTIVNSGDVEIRNLIVADDLATNLAPASVTGVANVVVTGSLSALNSNFDGIADPNITDGSESLAPGESAVITFDLTFKGNGNVGPFSNLANAAGESPGNPNPGQPNVEDDSTEGNDPDPNGNGDPTDDTTPTVIEFNPGVDGTVDITDESVPGDLLDVTVTDADENMDSAVVESFDVTVVNDQTGESEVITVVETGPDTGVFTAQVPTTFAPGPGADDDGTLVTRPEDTVTVLYEDRLTSVGDVQTRTDTGVVIGLATIEGSAWLDSDTDDVFDIGETPLDGWIIRVERDGVFVAEVPVNPDGSYSIAELLPGAGYSVSLIHPDSGVTFGVLEGLDLPPETVVLEQNLPIDPTGVFYDSVERTPVEGVITTIVNSAGTPLPAACLLPNQQDQTSAADGLYRFDLVLGGAPECPSGETFTLVYQVPSEFNPGISALLPPIGGALDPTGLGDPVRVAPQSGAPTLAQSTDYYLAFTLENGDPDIVFNHIPLDPLGVGGFTVRLTKDVNQPTATVGSLVSYTITLENLSTVALPGVSVVDSLPPGFSYVEDSAILDDGSDALMVSGTRPVTFAGINLSPDTRRVLRYVLRTGAGVTRGEYVNTAEPFIGPAPIGNRDSAEVVVIADPDFEETTVIGKVWNDRDEDGWQDLALATQLSVSVRLASGGLATSTLVRRGDEPARATDERLSDGGVTIDELPGLYGDADLRAANRVLLRERFDAPVSVREVEIRTSEGSVIKLDELGNVATDHRGQVRRGENSQSLQASYRVVDVDSGYELRVEVTNTGMDEPGIPGVRLATVEGLLIETDAYGRYHIAGVDGGFFERGRNFIVKVDPETLPSETRFTTENPRVKRISQGLMNRFDFGVHLPESAPLEQRFTVKIAEMFFIPGSATVEPGYLPALRDLADKLASGSFVTLSIEAFADPDASDAAAARELAERRAQALIDALCELAGRDVSANIDVSIAPPADVGSAAQGDNLMSMKQWLSGVLMAVSSVAWADEPGVDCTALDACRSADGIPVIVVEQHTASVYEPSLILPDQGRVDLYGESVQRLVDGGVIWLTEDPAALTPQLAIEGPSHLPLRGGRIDGDQEFVIYTNYAAFIDSLELRIYRDRDVDRRDPVAVLAIDTSMDKRNLYRLSWPVDGDGNLADGMANALGVSGLNFELIATSANGERDRTSVKRMFFIDADLYDSHQAQNNRFGDSLVPEVVLREAEDGVVVFLPPVSGEETAQTLRFTFAELSAELSESDKVLLTRELDRLSGTQLVRIRADGHTSSLGIAARSRHVFADNYALSKARAASVVDFARSHLGSLDAAVETNGFGPDQPIASNATPEGRADNRRVETLLATQTEGDSSKVIVVDRLSGAASAYQPRTTTSLADGTGGKAQDPALRAMGRNDLAIQRIPVYGSRIRLQGTDLGEDYRLWLNGEPVYVDDSRSFAYEYLLPIGEHQFDLIVANSARVVVERTLPVSIDGQYHFMVALADFTASDNDISGSLEALSGDDRYDEDMLVEGRLAFYLKGKVKGKYLITAQLDTREEEIDDLFSKIHEKDPDSLFRRLDPDRYYPVYGDDSKTVADTNSHGRMYVRIDWDRSQALWGNFDTGLTGNELIQYSRGLYGARLSYESLAATQHDDTRTLANAFASEGQTALGHSEFLGTGGSLYYLRHTDILPGSDKLRIEIRDPDTNRVIDNQLLAREIDYEIDEIQGRVILSRPLLQVSTQSAPSLINDGPVDGNVTILVADYEYVPDGFDANNVTAGARAKHWLNDSIAIGGTYVEEGRSNEDYRLGGIDVTLKPKQDTYLKVEWASSEATQTSRFFSTDGGLSFADSTPTGQGDRAGDAWGVDLHINAGDYGGNSEWVSNLWFRDVDDQYSVARRDDGNNTQEYGFETQIPITDGWLVGMRASRVDVQDQFELTEIGLQSDWRIGERGVLASELKQVDQRRAGQADADALLAGLQYEHRLTDWLTMFGGGQVTVDQSGPYDNNDAVNIGAKLAISSETNAEVELRDGHRGSGGVATIEHALNSKHTVYGTVTHSTDTTNDPFARSDNGASMLDNVGTNFAVGHRWRLNDRTLIFTEGQHSRGPDYSGVGEVFGIDYAMASGWHLGFTAQDGEITGNNGLVDRRSLTVSTGYQSRRLNFSSRLEHRDDSGAEDVVQWLTTNRLDFKINETYRLATKLNWSDSDSDLGSDEDAKLVEGSIGLARRPVETNRFNWLAKYTYLYDLQSFGQEDSETDQRSHVMSWEGIYRLNRKFDLGGKVARRESELRLGRNNGPWFESTANFASTRLRWHVIHNWDGMLEYRWLEVEEADNERAGFLATISRHIGEHFKVGVGYNFTDFSDDLTDLDYDHKGFFLNVVGKY